MIKIIKKLFFKRKVIVKAICIAQSISSGKINGNMKFPSISYSNDKNDEIIEGFFEKNAIVGYQIDLDYTNYGLVKYSNNLWINLNFEKNSTIFITFDTTKIEDIEYFIAILLSKTVSFHNKNKFEQYCLIKFKNEDSYTEGKISNFINELENIIGQISLKNDPESIKFTEKEIIQIVLNNPQFQIEIRDRIRDKWSL